uniref:Peptidase S8 pro-domain domain-containing protein n=1 Tax=Poecilia mexicana TaxID=48701 RepID=A0A3B3YGB6_9TELE
MDARVALPIVWTGLVLLTAELKWIDAAEIFTNTWAVQINGGPGEADRIAREHGFINQGNVFGDYYHFRHHAVEKRALSGHTGMHIRLQKEPQVRLVSALSQLTAALLIGNKKPEDRLDYTVNVYTSLEKSMPASVTACQPLFIYFFCSPHLSFHLYH